MAWRFPWERTGVTSSSRPLMRERTTRVGTTLSLTRVRLVSARIREIDVDPGRRTIIPLTFGHPSAPRVIFRITS